MKNNVSKSNNKLDNPRSISTTYVRPVVGSDNGFNASDINGLNKNSFPVEKKKKWKPILISCLALGAAASLSAVITIPLVTSHQSQDENVNQDSNQNDSSTPGTPGGGTDSRPESSATIKKQIQETSNKLSNLVFKGSAHSDEITKDNISQYFNGWFSVDPASGVNVQVDSVSVNAVINTNIDVTVTLHKKGISEQKAYTYGGFGAPKATFDEAWKKLESSIYFKHDETKRITVTEAKTQGAKLGPNAEQYYISSFINGFNGTIGAYGSGIQAKLVSLNYGGKIGTTLGSFTFRLSSGRVSREYTKVCDKFKPNGQEYLDTKSNWSDIRTKDPNRPLGSYYYKDFIKFQWDSQSDYTTVDQAATERAIKELLINLPQSDNTFQIIIVEAQKPKGTPGNYDYLIKELDILVGFRYKGEWSHLNTHGEYRAEGYSLIRLNA